MKSSYKTALCGVSAALSIVCMLLTTLVPIATYSCAILAGMINLIVLIELKGKWSWGVYAAVGILSILLVPDKEAVVYYIALFGYYPIVKQMIEKKKNRIIQWLLKLLTFNMAVIAAFFVTVYILGVPKESFEIAGYYLPWVFLIIGNPVFVLYDVALTGVVLMYIIKYRKILFKTKR